MIWLNKPVINSGFIEGLNDTIAYHLEIEVDEMYDSTEYDD